MVPGVQFIVNQIGVRVITPAQLRAARALLGISQLELAALAGVGSSTVKRIEASPTGIRGTALSLVKLQRALEAAGVRFLFEDEKAGVGVRLSGSSTVC